MERDNHEVAQDGVESSAPLLQGGGGGGWLTKWRKQRRKLYILSNPPNKEIHKRIETNENNKLSSSGENKSEGEEASASVGMKSVL